MGLAICFLGNQCAFQDAFATLFDFETSEKGTNADLKVIRHKLLLSKFCICILCLFSLNTDYKRIMRHHEASRKQFCFVVGFFYDESHVANGHSSSCAGLDRQLNGICSSSAFDRCYRVNMDMLS